MPTQPRPTAPAPQPPELLSVAEAARRLYVSLQTVRDWYHAGRLPGDRIGNNIKLSADSVAALPKRMNLTMNQQPQNPAPINPFAGIIVQIF